MSEEVVQRLGRGEYTERGNEDSVQYPQFSDEDLAQRSARPSGEAPAVRTLMHYYHLGLGISGLSRLMLSRLQKGGWTCPLCRESFPDGMDPRQKRT
jgi:hypothetical protein